jgi:transcriptional regulator with XRE-family HTH domain
VKAVHWIVAALHKARLEDDMTRSEVGERVGRSDRTVASWEIGEAEPGLVQIEAWAATHGLYLTLTPDRPRPAPLAAESANLVMAVQVRRMFVSGEARRIRQAADLSLRDAASAAGVDPKALQRWETCVWRPTIHYSVVYGRFLLALQRVLGEAA